ncbi:phytanoyl-CoA dioxygenase family protein [Mesorhizobium sp. B1-1-1]|uniref:phytanoyl-CoA dioxygenase family protein n=1 Tax=Mesorhizobium sp. B1-1-1 TaxID=2589983 RepID=UPI00112AA619|nr:phytanoyl-CoA dioxygenase family protein [Mesorhizobium sp. B1-1-1]TPN63596.1 phytanoyl-CoA dioxygenase family protein [Mesorhizobium sp. B1-1-1]
MIDSDFEPNPEDVAFFGAHGWWLSGLILTDAELDDLRYAFERYAAGERDRQLPRSVLPQWSGALERGVRQADYLSLQLDDVMEFVRLPLLPRLASALSGAEEIRLFHDQLVWKDPVSLTHANSSVGWHTDRAYWRSCTSVRMLTAWIPLQDTDEHMGPLAVWDGSHLWPDIDDLHTFDEPDLASLEARFRALGRDVDVRLIPMKRGHVSFHHCRLVHGSYPNRSDRPRLGFAIHYQDGANQHIRSKGGADAEAVHLNDMLCRTNADGAPDYSDPEVCPVLWRTTDRQC